MALLTTLGMIGGAAGSVMNFIGGSAAAAEGRRKLDQFQWQDLSTSAAETLAPSLKLEEDALLKIQQNKERFADVASQGGDAGSMLAMLTAGEEQTGAQEQQLYGNMQKQEFDADMVRVQDEQQRRGMQEQRDFNEVQSLQAQVAGGEQMKGDAITNFSKTMMSAGIGQEAANAEAGFDPMGMFQFGMSKPKKKKSTS
jgi:hypothetical protein|tara:strand:+ start:1744 stop:2337 length:594 start_codon:yes stop_codon:yes gene_type:complete